MASGAPTLALKAAAVAAVLAVLILPSMGRCPSLGPEPPAPPTPAPAPAPVPSPGPAPAPAISSCRDCWSNCYVTCRASTPSRCSEPCDSSGCDFCISSERKKCQAECCSSSGGNGTSSSCSCDDCNNRVPSSCRGACSYSSRSCGSCLNNYDQWCQNGCSSDCAPPACIEEN